PGQFAALDHLEETRLTDTVDAHEVADLVPTQQAPGPGLGGGNRQASMLARGPGATVHFDQRVVLATEDALRVFRVWMIAQQGIQKRIPRQHGFDAWIGGMPEALRHLCLLLSSRLTIDGWFSPSC